jgi:hypothetical protein
MTEKPAKPATRRRRVAKPKTAQMTPSYDEISERAYFIYLEEGEPDQLENWLRAERELMAA